MVNTAHVDLIGPNANGYYGATMIYHATRWLEVAIKPDKKNFLTSFLIVNGLPLPHPMKVVHDQKIEFTGEEFQKMLRSYGIQAKPITSKKNSSQSNF